MKSSWRLSFLHLDCTFSCSIIDVRKAIVFFTAERKSKNFEILAREWRSSNDTSFYLFSTTLKTLSGAQSFGTLSLILRKREFINMPFYQIWLKVTAGIKTKTSQRHSSKLETATEFRIGTKTKYFLWYQLRCRRPIWCTVLFSRWLEAAVSQYFLFSHLWR